MASLMRTHSKQYFGNIERLVYEVGMNESSNHIPHVVGQLSEVYACLE